MENPACTAPAELLRGNTSIVRGQASRSVMIHSSLERTRILLIFNHQQDRANPPPLPSPVAVLEMRDSGEAARCCHLVVEHSSVVEQCEWLVQWLDSDLRMKAFACVNEEE